MGHSIEKQFEQMGARIVVRPPTRRVFLVRAGNRLFRDRQRWNRDPIPAALRVDIREDRRGEFFEIVTDPDRTSLSVLDVRAADRHLLLVSRTDDGGGPQKFLCGHDERHWFVAAVPESAAAENVRRAMEALKPAEVRQAQERAALRARGRVRRRNAAFVRQGEWFFVPAPEVQVADWLVLRDEPLRRGRGKPHRVEYLYRTGGETVYVCGRYPNGLIEATYRRILAENHGASTWGWQMMRRNPEVLVRGRVRHADHATIVLNGWHRVYMNTKTQARAMQQVAFLD